MMMYQVDVEELKVEWNGWNGAPKRASHVHQSLDYFLTELY